MTVLDQMTVWCSRLVLILQTVPLRFDFRGQNPETKISPDFIILVMSSRTSQLRVSCAFHAAFYSSSPQVVLGGVPLLSGFHPASPIRDGRSGMPSRSLQHSPHFMEYPGYSLLHGLTRWRTMPHACGQKNQISRFHHNLESFHLVREGLKIVMKSGDIFVFGFWSRESNQISTVWCMTNSRLRQMSSDQPEMTVWHDYMTVWRSWLVVILQMCRSGSLSEAKIQRQNISRFHHTYIYR